MFCQKTLHEMWCMSGHVVVMKLSITICSYWSLLKYSNSLHRGMFKLNAEFDANSLLYSLSHFECDGHTVHMLTQWCLLPLLTSTVKSSLFTHTHSSPFFLAARLHWCRANHSRYRNNGLTFSGGIYIYYIYILYIYIWWFTFCHMRNLSKFNFMIALGVSLNIT